MFRCSTASARLRSVWRFLPVSSSTSRERLLILRLQQAHFGVLLLFAGMEDGHLVSDGLRVRNRQFFREGGRFAFQLGVKADDRKLVLQDPVLGVAVLALGKFVVELRKRRALFNDFPSPTRTAPKIPPSRFWMICVRCDEMTCPLAWVTSSISAKFAQMPKMRKKRPTANERKRAPRRGLRASAASTSLT